MCRDGHEIKRLLKKDPLLKKALEVSGTPGLLLFFNFFFIIL